MIWWPSPAQQVRQKLLGIDPEEDPVNGLKLQGVVVEVDQLHQGVTGGVGLALCLGQSGLELLPAGLGGGQGVIAVAHGVGQHRLALGVVELSETGRVCQAGQLLLHLVGLFLGEKIPRDPAALFHQGGAVNHLHLLFALLPQEGLDDFFLGSSMRTIMWGNSMGAFFRTFIRGGMRERTVPSVARMGVPDPFS